MHASFELALLLLEECHHVGHDSLCPHHQIAVQQIKQFDML